MIWCLSSQILNPLIENTFIDFIRLRDKFISTIAVYFFIHGIPRSYFLRVYSKTSNHWFFALQCISFTYVYNFLEAKDKLAEKMAKDDDDFLHIMRFYLCGVYTSFPKYIFERLILRKKLNIHGLEQIGLIYTALLLVTWNIRFEFQILATSFILYSMNFHPIWQQSQA